MIARLFACALALALAFAGLPARAAGMPSYGTKNFTPGPATPSYFAGERGVPYAGPRGFPVRREIRPWHPTAAAAPARGRGDLYARPAAPAREAAVRRRWTRPAHVRRWYYRVHARRARLLRLARLRALQLRRLRALRLARLRRLRAWRR